MLLGCASPARLDTTQRASVAPDGCGDCHAVEAAEWASSLHRASFTDADFQRAFAREPLPFCEQCHAPRTREEGVSCIHCHELDRSVSRTGRHAPTRAVPCSRCHEFDFPDAPLAMQSTASEHARSEFSTRACAECHLPRRAGHRDHRFAVTRNAAWLRGALAPVTTHRDGDQIVVTLQSRGVGHAFPTGDLFRRLRVRYWSEDAAGTVLVFEERLLGKRYERHHGVGDGVTDTRLAPRREERFPAQGVRGHVSVDYERVAAPTVHDAELFDSITLAEASWPL